jgi:hypothetical protein
MDDNKENKKDAMKHPEDENAKSRTKKENDEEVSEGKDISEESDMLDNMPDGMKRKIQSFMSMGISGSMLSPFESKINEKHIDKILEIKDKYDEKVFKDTQQSRKFLLVYILIGVSLFVFLTLFLVGKDTELFKDIIKLFIAFVGGMGAGYGLKSYISNR